MSFFKIEKTSDFKKVSFCGISIKLKRSHFKKGKRLCEIPLNLRDDGISLIAFFNQISGEANVAKNVLSAIKKSDISFDCFDLSKKISPVFKNKITFTTSYYYKPQEYNNISVLYWEFESGMLQVRPYVFEGVNSVITFSDFCASYFKTIAPENIRIIKLPYPFEIDKTILSDPMEIRRKYKFEENDFVCFFNFSYFSSYYRKNPQGVLDAFSKAFSSVKNAKLLIKTNGSEIKKDLSDLFHREIVERHLENKVVVIDENVSECEMLSLLNSCDVYISLHRGEGLGLGMLEAMSLGKPVVATNYGGNTDFVKSGIAFPVGYTLVKPQLVDLNAYKYVEQWAEPNIDEAAKYLRQLYESDDLRKNIGKKAEAFIAKNYAPEKFIQTLKEEFL